MAGVVAALERLAADIARRTEEPVGRASLAVTTIRGGTARNVVPARCEISLDRRLLPRENAAEARAEIEAAVRAACPRGAEVRQSLVADAAATDPGDAIVRLASETVARLRGSPERTSGFGACCDMRLFRNLGGMPVVILGPGSLSQAHRADERVPESEVRLAARIYEETAERWLDRP
jgi:acetylornithine deacetylase/succinyl-diaminopimelate desuccinylase